jgi:hypothetical protein
METVSQLSQVEGIESSSIATTAMASASSSSSEASLEGYRFIFYDIISLLFECIKKRPDKNNGRISSNQTSSVILNALISSIRTNFVTNNFNMTTTMQSLYRNFNVFQLLIDSLKEQLLFAHKREEYMYETVVVDEVIDSSDKYKQQLIPLTHRLLH